MKALLKLLAGLVVLGLVLIIALVVTLARLDPNEYKGWIETRFQKETNRALSLEGDLKITFYPWLGLETNGLTVANAPGFGDQPLFHSDHMELRVKLLPLLKEQYEIDTVRIHGAVVNLAKNKEGKTNWGDLVGAETKEAKSSGAAGFPLAAMVLGGVDIQKAKLSWNDQTTGTRYNISQLTVTTDKLTYGKPINLKLTVAASSNKPELNGDLTLAGIITYDLKQDRYDVNPLQLVSTLKGKNVPDGQARLKMSAVIGVDMDKKTAVVSDLDISALGTRINGTVNASNLDEPRPSLQSSLKVEGDDLGVLFKVAEQEELARQIAQLKEKKFSVSATMDSDMQRGDVALSALKAQLLGATILGDIKARNIESPTPAFEGELTATGPDLPTLLQVLGQFQGGSRSLLAQYGKGFSRFKDRDFSIKADFNTDMRSGDARVDTLNVNAAGIKLNGNLRAAKMQTKTPSFKGTLTASGPDLPALLEIAGRAQGKGSLMQYGKQLGRAPDRSFEVETNFDADLESGDIELPTLSVDTLGLKLKGMLETKNLHDGKGTVNGKLELTGTDLSGILMALDQKGLAEVLQSVDFHTDIKGKGQDIQLAPMQLVATFAGKQLPDSPVALTLSADTGLNLEKDSLAMNNLDLAGLGLNVKGKLHADKISAAPEFSGQINVAPFNLRKFMQQTNQALPVTADNTVLSKVAMDTAFSGSAKNLNVSELALVLDQTNIKGNASITDFNNPAIQFRIEMDGINADRYMPPAQDGKARKPVTPEAAGAAAIQLPVEFLRSLNARSDLKIGQLVFSNAKLANVAMSLNGKDGKIKLDPVTADLYEGRYAGDISIDATGKLPKLVINSTLKGVQLGPLLTDISGKPTVSGKGTVNLAVVTLGPDGEAMKQTLNGEGKLDLEKGVLQGVDVRGILDQVEMMIEDKRIGKVDRGKETPFDKLTATLDINAGIISNRDLLLTAPGFRVDGKGVVANLHNGSLDYDMRVSVDKTSATRGEERYNLGGYFIPINCRGQLKEPDCKPDTGGVLKEALKRSLVEKLNKALNKGQPPEQQPQPAPAGTGEPATAPAPTQQPTQQPTQPPAQPVDPRQELLKKILKGISR